MLESPLNSLINLLFGNNNDDEAIVEIYAGTQSIDSAFIEPQFIAPRSSLTFSVATRSVNSAYARKGLVESNAVRRLRSSQAMLEDIEIYEYLRYSASLEHNAKISVIHSGYFCNGNFREDFLEGLAKPDGERRKIRAQLLNAELILCPIEFGRHWYLLAISKATAANTFNIRCLDGLNRTRAHLPLLAAGQKLMEQLYGVDKFKYDLQSAEVARQENGYDCGTVVSFYGAKLCKKPNLFETHDKYPLTGQYHNFRREMIRGLNNSAKPPVKPQPSVSCSAASVNTTTDSLFTRTPTPTPRAY